MKRTSRLRAVSIQIRVRVHRPKNVELTKSFLVDAVRYRTEYGEDLPGIEITGIYWEKSGRTYTYEGDRIDGALQSMLKFIDMRPGVFHPVRAD